VTHGMRDPEVSRAMTEYLLIAEAGLRPAEIDAMPEDRVAMYAAIALRGVQDRTKMRMPSEPPRVTIRRSD